MRWRSITYLVLSNEPFIENIDILDPLWKCYHSLISIDCELQTEDVIKWWNITIWLKSSKLSITYMMQKYHHSLCLTKRHIYTRGNRPTFHCDLRKHFFSARIVNIWNSLPNSVVEACSVNAFNVRLDKIWFLQEVKFEFTASLTGTGNRSKLEGAQRVHMSAKWIFLQLL